MKDCSFGGGTTALEWTTKEKMSCYIIKQLGSNHTPMVKWLSCLPSIDVVASGTGSIPVRRMSESSISNFFLLYP